MSITWILLAYGLAFALALLLLRYFHGAHCRWYWHAGAIVLAFVIGLMPPPQNWVSPQLDLAVGSVFIFLIMWGAAAPIFRTHRHR